MRLSGNGVTELRTTRRLTGLEVQVEIPEGIHVIRRCSTVVLRQEVYLGDEMVGARKAPQPHTITVPCVVARVIIKM